MEINNDDQANSIYLNPIAPPRRARVIGTFSFEDDNIGTNHLKCDINVAHCDTKLYKSKFFSTKKFKAKSKKEKIMKSNDAAGDKKVSFKKPDKNIKNNKKIVKIDSLNESIYDSPPNSQSFHFSNESNVRIDKNKYNLNNSDDENHVSQNKEIKTVTKCRVNHSLKNNKHRRIKFLEDFRLIKMYKIMSLTETRLQDQYLKAFRKSSQFNLLNLYIEKYKYNVENSLGKYDRKYTTNKSNITVSMKTNPSICYDNEPNLSSIKPTDENIRLIKLRGALNQSMSCHFKYFFQIYLVFTKTIIYQIIDNQKHLYVTNPRQHNQITIQYNDFLRDENNVRYCKVLVQSSSKAGLIHLLDQIDNYFPTWNIWKNGSIAV